MVQLRLQLLVGQAYGPAGPRDRGLEAAVVWERVSVGGRAAVARRVGRRALGVGVRPGQAVHVSRVVAVGGHTAQELLDQGLVARIEAHPCAGRLPEDQMRPVVVQDGPAAVREVGGRVRARVVDGDMRVRKVGDDRAEGPGLGTGGTRAEQPERRRDDDGGPHFALSQSGPTPASTASGGSISNAAPISRPAISLTCSASCSGPSNSSSSWICKIILERTPARRRAASHRTIATFMMSAAVPWITMLTANRSPWRRISHRRERSSGTWRRRPNSVET